MGDCNVINNFYLAQDFVVYYLIIINIIKTWNFMWHFILYVIHNYTCHVHSSSAIAVLWLVLDSLYCGQAICFVRKLNTLFILYIQFLCQLQSYQASYLFSYTSFLPHSIILVFFRSYLILNLLITFSSKAKPSHIQNYSLCASIMCSLKRAMHFPLTKILPLLSLCQWPISFNW